MTDRKAIRCAACGGPVAPGAVRCAFCGSQLAQAACPACLALVPTGARHCASCGRPVDDREDEPGPSLACPACRGPLGSVRAGAVPLRPCLACGGIWMSRTDFEVLARTRESRDLFLGSPLGQAPEHLTGAGPETVRYRPCPCCGKLMNRVNFARISGVILDACREDGLWFDQDELRKVVQFIESGGLDRAARREREAAPRTLPGGAPEEGAGTLGVLHGTQADVPALVGELLWDAARLAARILT